MRPALFALFALLALASCGRMEDVPTSTALPKPAVSLIATAVQRDFVLLVWTVEGGQGRRFEIQRQNRAEPWKHFATVEPFDGQIRVEDRGVVPGQRYVYRIRLYGTTGQAFLDEVEVAVPL